MTGMLLFRVRGAPSSELPPAGEFTPVFGATGLIAFESSEASVAPVEGEAGTPLDEVNWTEAETGESIDFAGGPMTFGYRIIFNAAVNRPWTFLVDRFRVTADCSVEPE